jgi:hypothetical protein
MEEEIVNIELTQAQFNHIRDLLAQTKPSRTRLTQEEKGLIRLLCNKWSKSYDSDLKEEKLIESILKKLV